MIYPYLKQTTKLELSYKNIKKKLFKPYIAWRPKDFGEPKLNLKKKKKKNSEASPYYHLKTPPTSYDKMFETSLYAKYNVV